MSIIYDALKKVGQADKLTAGLPAARPSSFTPAHKPKVYLLYILAVTVVVITAVLLFNPFKKAISINPQETPQTPPVDIAPAGAMDIEQPSGLNPDAGVPADQAAFSTEPLKEEEPLPPALVLNGVFISDNETYALVNNQIVKIGDTIDGAVVQKIAMNEVELGFAGKTIQLHTGS